MKKVENQEKCGRIGGQFESYASPSLPNNQHLGAMFPCVNKTPGLLGEKSVTSGSKRGEIM